MDKSVQASTSAMETPVIEPATQAFLDALASRGGKPIYQLCVEDARGVLDGLQSQPVEKLPVREDDLAAAGYWATGTRMTAWCAKSPMERVPPWCS